MTESLKTIVALLFGFSFLVLMSMLIGQDCDANPNRSPLKTINMASKGECTYNQ